MQDQQDRATQLGLLHIQRRQQGAHVGGISPKVTYAHVAKTTNTEARVNHAGILCIIIVSEKEVLAVQVFKNTELHSNHTNFFSSNKAKY